MQVNLKPVNQITDPDVNHNEDCVAACMASCVTALTGKNVSLDTLKDAAYGTQYKGFQDAMQYARVLATYGIQITEVSGYVSTVVSGALNRGHPVLLTIPSDWGDTPPTSPYSHVVAACGATATDLTAMNPWGGFFQAQPWGWWASRQRGNYYILSKGSAMLPTGWKDDGNFLTAPNQLQCHGAIREYILARDYWDADLQPIAHEHQTVAGWSQSFGLDLNWTQATNTVSEVPTVATASLAHLALPEETPVGEPEPVIVAQSSVPAPEPAPVVGEEVAVTQADQPEPASAEEPAPVQAVEVPEEVAVTQAEQPTAHTALQALQAELERVAALIQGKK